ncbi:MAG: MBL fold metallo-hydrolase [Chloroflexi bacterium]|nr:MBL fold metallo-hydrolase [Chloroflexota bacterium]
MSVHYEDETFKLQVFVSGFSNNAWLLTDKASDESLIIDTPGNPAELLNAAGETSVIGILITHNHSDHLEGFGDVYASHAVPVGIGADDAPAIASRLIAGSIDVAHDVSVSFGGLSLTAISTPGHTPGSTCYYLPSNGGHLFSGDTLFPGGPGKSGSPAAFAQMLEGISTKLLTLPATVAVHPGHGDDSNVAKSLAEYEMFASGDHDSNLFGDVTWLGV